MQEERANRHEDWSEFQSMTDLVLTPAACYPVYPAVAARGPLGAGGITVDAGGSYVFRHEPSGDPARLQMFHQREIVRIGEPETVAAWRDAWRDRSVQLLRAVGLDARARRRKRPVLRAQRAPAAAQPAGAGSSSSRCWSRSRAPSRPRSPRSTTTRTTSPRPTGSDGRRRRTGAHRVPRLRPRADHARAAAHARLRRGRVAGGGAGGTGIA